MAAEEESTTNTAPLEAAPEAEQASTSPAATDVVPATDAGAVDIGDATKSSEQLAVASDNFVSSTAAVNEAFEPAPEKKHIPLMQRVPNLCPPLTELCVEVLAANFRGSLCCILHHYLCWMNKLRIC